MQARTQSNKEGVAMATITREDIVADVEAFLNDVELLIGHRYFTTT